MDPAQEDDLIEKVAEVHAVVHEKVVPWLEEVNGTVSGVLAQQHRVDGALSMLRWILMTAIAVVGVVGGYIFTEADDPRPLPPIEIELQQPTPWIVEGGR